MRVRHLQQQPWRDPLDILRGWPDAPYATALVSGGGGRWSWLARDPDAVETFHPDYAGDPFPVLDSLLGETAESEDGPPFTGGVIGFASYELADRIETLNLEPAGDWPDLVLMRFPAVLVLDHERRELWAAGRGETPEAAQEQSNRAAGWLQGKAGAPYDGVLADEVEADDPLAFEAAVGEVRERIAAGEIFQANIARRWTGRLARNARPFDLFDRLSAQSPAPFASWLALPGRALVSNSPERFVSVRPQDGALMVETWPIKGTAPRGKTPAEDKTLAEWLSASLKDRAENLMIVDLMRNDLARVCEPGSVATPELFRIETYANVHHMVSVVRGKLNPGARLADLMRAIFPPGSITGAPKVQAMKVIAELEAPRGPFFGSMFWAGPDGGFDSSVLIRTAGFIQAADGWRFEARAGGGIVSDSVPHTERAETETKISAMLKALTEAAS